MFWRKEINMRTIKFRGKRIDNGEWVSGSLDLTASQVSILWDRIDNEGDTAPWFADVDPDTIGQFTGLLDKNDKEIYEGDIINLNDEDFELEHGNGIVVFLDKDAGGRPCGGLWYLEDADEDSNTENSLYDLWYEGTLEIIGNIHDNPELLKGGESNE